MKKGMQLLLCIVLCLLLAACGGKQPGSGTEGTSPPANHAPYDLKIIAFASENKQSTYQKIVDGFLELYPYYNISLEITESEDSVCQRVEQSDYDILFLETVAMADKLHETNQLQDMERFWEEQDIREKISGLILPYWDRVYAIPLFLKVDCIFSDTQTYMPVDYAAQIERTRPEDMGCITCTGLFQDAEGIIPIGCTCVAVGSRANRKHAEFFLQTLYDDKFLPGCVSNTGLPMACRVRLSEAKLPLLTQSIYQSLSEPQIQLQYQEE